MRTKVAGVLLAAGEGSRLGRPKALVELAGQTLTERGVRLLQAGGADPILIVTGAVPLAPVIPVIPLAPVESGQIRMVHNERWRTGMGSSLCAALVALSETGLSETGLSETGLSETGLSETGLSEVGAVVVALADQPLVGAAAVARLIAAYRDGASVAVAAYDGRPRNPVLLAREHWPEILATATGDQGARAFLRARADLVTLIECGDTGRPDDIDTAEDLERVARLASEHSASENSASENRGQGREPRIVREKRT